MNPGPENRHSAVEYSTVTWWQPSPGRLSQLVDHIGLGGILGEGFDGDANSSLACLTNIEMVPNMLASIP
jgi:hypothetical protein